VSRRLGGAVTGLCRLYVYLLLWLVVYAVVAALVLTSRPVMITGGSMSPGITPGDLVLLDRDVEHPLGPGTVITYHSAARNGGLVTHRVTAVLPEGYRTRGDANLTEDSDLVRPSAVVGAGRLLVPALGRPLIWLRGGHHLPAAAWLLLTAAAATGASRTARSGFDAHPRSPGRHRAAGPLDRWRGALPISAT
jgi:signal peptidase I